MKHDIKKIGLSLLCAGLFLVGCELGTGGGDDRGPIDTDTPRDGSSRNGYHTVSHHLKIAADCSEVADAVRKRAFQEMIEAVDARLNDLLENEGSCWRYYDGDLEYANDVVMPDTGPGSGAEEYTTTNNQVAGVDEADFIKNDGSYIYVLADGKFQIVDAWPAEQAHKLSEIGIDGEPKKMFVHGNRAVIYSSLDPLQASDPSFNYGYYSYGAECTYGYDCDFTGDGRALKMTVLDIADKQALKVIRETTFNGSYLNSRRIENAVYTLAVFPEIDSRQYWDEWPEELDEYRYSCREDVPLSDSQIRHAFWILKSRNATRLQQMEVTDILPSIVDQRESGGQLDIQGEVLGDCTNFYLGDEGDGSNILTLVSFDITEQEPLDTATILGRPGAVYASGDALYIASRHYRSQMGGGWYFDEQDGNQEASTIHKFALQPAEHRAAYVASGVVKGRVLNQFSMDEHNGHLRIATTSGRVPDPNVHSTVSVLGEEGAELALAGQVDNIAPTEDIRSARFNGEVGFIVTFKKTDPLFVLDLSDPTQPAIEGELKIPGYSTYMHLLDESHLLTIGYDADDQGSFAWFQGIQLQIIDVSDLANPELIHREIIGTRGTSSEAATNHLAFTYFPSRNWLAIPLTVCEDSSGGGSYGYNMTFSGLYVYEATMLDGFSHLGGVPHTEPTAGDDYWSTCGSWWTDSNTLVKRSIFMDDYVYSVAPDQILVSAVADLAHPVATISLAD